MTRDDDAPCGRYPGRRALLLAAPVGALLSFSACSDDGDAPARAAGSPAGASPAPDVTGWTSLPAAPLRAPVVREGQAAVWTGSQVLVWGGSTPLRDGCAIALTGDGAAWTPGSDGVGSWAVLPQAPVAARSRAHLWWTGSSAVLVGGLDPWGACEARPAGFLDAASFTPWEPGSESGEGAWTRLPDLPWPAGTTVDAGVWAGGDTGRVLVWSAVAGAWSLRLADAAWTRLPDPPFATPGTPISWSAVSSCWTGSEWLVMGRVAAADPVEVGWGFDPVAAVWRTLDPGPLAASAITPVWTGERLFAFDVEEGASSFDPAANRWTAAPAGPLDDLGAWSPDGGPTLAWTGAELVVWGGARRGRDTGMCTDGVGVDDSAFAYGGSCNPATGPLGAAFDPARGSWRLVPDGPWQRRGDTTAVWTGTSVFFAGGVDLELARDGKPPPFPDHPDQAFALFTPEQT